MSEEIEYGYYWWRHHTDGSTFIACRDEEDGQWYMPAIETSCPPPSIGTRHY